jgi:hypothetical protein
MNIQVLRSKGEDGEKLDIQIPEEYVQNFMRKVIGSRVNIHSIPCPYGNSDVHVIVRDGIDPHDPPFPRGDAILNRLKSGPIIYAMCPLALSAKSGVYMKSDRDKAFTEKMTKYKCPAPEGCMYASAAWEPLENFLF